MVILGGWVFLMSEVPLYWMARIACVCEMQMLGEHLLDGPAGQLLEGVRNLLASCVTARLLQPGIRGLSESFGVLITLRP